MPLLHERNAVTSRRHHKHLHHEGFKGLGLVAVIGHAVLSLSCQSFAEVLKDYLLTSAGQSVMVFRTTHGCR